MNEVLDTKLRLDIERAVGEYYRAGYRDVLVHSMWLLQAEAEMQGFSEVYRRVLRSGFSGVKPKVGWSQYTAVLLYGDR